MKLSVQKFHRISFFPPGKAFFLGAILLAAGLIGSGSVPARERQVLNTSDKEIGSGGIFSNADKSTASHSNGESSAVQFNESQLPFIQPISTKLKPGTNIHKHELESRPTLAARNEAQNYSTGPTQLSENNRTSIASKQDELVKFTEAQRKELEMALELKNPGVYYLYKQLGLPEKHAVLQKYIETKKISAARKTVIRLFSGN